MPGKLLKPTYLFEVSWEVCNKIGGIHTVISTKALTLSKLYGDKYICIGPDVLKDMHDDYEFIEDKFLFKSWRKKAQKENIHIRVGRWNIPGEPVAILVDFTPFFSSKDKIFTDLWLDYGVNSLSGQWDYTEPVMFGYAAGQVIEHFYDYYFSSRDRFIAHFHEWMTGSGVLYLNKKVPQAATVFTTHATTLGRSASGNGLPLYKEMEGYNPEKKAEELGVVSKHSMEQKAANNADAFTTVSDITNHECELFLQKAADQITVNGFENDFVPKGNNFLNKQQAARELLIRVAKGLLCQEISDDSLLVAHSGRYEMKNKGIDIYIDALGKINRDNPDKTVLAFIMIPANQTGAKPEVVQRVKDPDMDNPLSYEYATHKLVDEDNDTIINKLKENDLGNKPGDKVKVIFIPAYLDGNDGVINLKYYDTLIGFDITVFPSYYEPWGYTPLESIAFNIPTITTELTGFGKYVRSNFKYSEDAVLVVDRNDDNFGEASDQVAGKLKHLAANIEQGEPLVKKLGKSAKILAVEEDTTGKATLAKGLERAGFKNIKRTNIHDNWIGKIAKEHDVVIIKCAEEPKYIERIDKLSEVKTANPDTSVVLLTNEKHIKRALEAADNGICYYFLDDDKYDEELKYFAERISGADILKPNHKANIISYGLLWKMLANNYYKTFDLAVKKVNERKDMFREKTQLVKPVELQTKKVQKPKWKKILIEISLPDELSGLEKLSKNIWWTWNYEAVDLFESIDPGLWQNCEKNPVRLLENLTTGHYNTLLNDKDFMKRYSSVIGKFNKYIDDGKNRKDKQIAYFSMEYGLHESIKIYSGGLGVLAGDYLKQASDDNINMIGVGLLYRFGYFTQSLSLNGDQVSNYYPHSFAYMSAVPVRNEAGEWVKIKIALPGRILHAKAWKIDIGRVPLYLLDTDLPENAPHDRIITHQLYGGDWENRFKQEFLLGIGGIRLLDALGAKPEIYHLNEGHAAFAGLERIRIYVQEEKLKFYEALEVVKASSLFTTHTPVPAGHDSFNEDMLRTYMPHYADRLGISWESFMDLGKMNPGNAEEDFSMSVLAANLSQEINGVSRIHGKVAREMFAELYPGYFPDELHIGYVTNGVHYKTWTAKAWQKLYESTFGDGFLNDVSDVKYWEKIYKVDDEKIWHLRNDFRQLLVDYIKQRIISNLSDRQENPKRAYKTIDALDENALTIGFARRFATYKRAHLLFNDPGKLSRIVNKEGMPVQFIFAGKAHPADKAGQDLIKKIVEYSNMDEFRGKIIFLEDYDMELARYLVHGVDIWFNTPTRPLEASGTSGQKAALNGVLNFSVLDGWWAEGYQPETGWSIKEERTYENQALQDDLDAAIIYDLLENEIIPMFFDRNDKQIPVEWVKWIKNNIAKVAPVFTNKRMLDDYFRHFYNSNFKFSKILYPDNYAKAKEFSSWKDHIAKSWDSLEVKSMNVLNTADNSLLLGDNFVAEITLDLKELSSEDIGMETVFIQKSFEEEDEVGSFSIHPMEQVESGNNHVTFKVEIASKKAGVYNYAFRIYPRHELLAHRQDFPIVRWL